LSEFIPSLDVAEARHIGAKARADTAESNWIDPTQTAFNEEEDVEEEEEEEEDLERDHNRTEWSRAPLAKSLTFVSTMIGIVNGSLVVPRISQICSESGIGATETDQTWRL